MHRRPAFRILLGAFGVFLALLAGTAWAVYAGVNAATGADTTELTVRVTGSESRTVTVRLPRVECTIRPNGGIVIRNTPTTGFSDQIVADYVWVSSRYGVTITGGEVSFSSDARFDATGDEVRFDELPGSAVLVEDGPIAEYEASLSGTLHCARG